MVSSLFFVAALSLAHGPKQCSAVGVLAILDRVDAEGLRVLFGEADAVVADAETLLAALVLQGLDAARAGSRQPMNGGEAMCCGTARISALASSEKTIRFKPPGPALHLDGGCESVPW